MFVSTGLRASELIGLNWGAVDMSRRLAFIGETKMGVSRTVPLSGRLAEDLVVWREDRLRRGEAVSESDPVFVSSASRRWCDTNGLRKCLRTCARAAGLDLKGLTTHSLRHTFVSLALDAGMPVGRVKAISGHRTLSMLAHYTHGVSDGHEVAEALDPASNGTRRDNGETSCQHPARLLCS